MLYVVLLMIFSEFFYHFTVCKDVITGISSVNDLPAYWLHVRFQLAVCIFENLKIYFVLCRPVVFNLFVPRAIMAVFPNLFWLAPPFLKDPSKIGSQPLWGRDPRLKTTAVDNVFCDKSRAVHFCV